MTMLKTGRKILAAALCALLLLTACAAEEKKESPFAALEDDSSSSASTGSSHPFAGTSSSEPETSSSVPTPDTSSSEPPADASSGAQSASSAASSSTAQTEPTAISTNRKATVRADGGLRLRSIASENGEKLLTIPDGTPLEYTEWKNGWAKTTFNGQTGYVSTTYLLFNATVRAEGGLRLRSGAGESTDKIGLIPDGTTIQCLEQKNGWIKTTYNNQTGYVSQQYVRIEATVNAGPGLNLREKPDAEGNKITVIPNGAAVSCIGNQEDGWIRVVYDDKEGYVASTYLAFV